ncbi:MFS transporter [Halomonas salifodinae]|uniref:MFS transporter n=1 Tax=Halomonas salifodinae TaxID=438745 RepID=UPI0033A5086C
MPLFQSAYHRRVTLTYFLAFVAIGLTGGLLGPALPHLAEMTGASMSQIALLFTARALGNMLGSVSVGVLVDRLPGHPVLMAMVVIMALGLGLAPLSPSLMLLIGVIFVMGFAEVSINAGSNTLLLWTHRQAAGPYISALHFCFALGNMLAPLAVVAAIHWTGQFQWAFWLVGLYSLSLLFWLRRDPGPRPPEADGSDAAGGERATPSPGRGDTRLLGTLMLLFSLYVGAEITFAGWITAYAVLQGEPGEGAALLVTLFWLALSAGRLLAIPLLRLISPWWLLLGCLGLGLASALSMPWLPLWLIALGYGLAASAIFPTLFSLCNRLMSMSGKRTGLVFLASGLGAMLVPSLTGPLLDGAGAQAFPWLLAALMGLLLLGVAALWRLARGR